MPSRTTTCYVSKYGPQPHEVRLLEDDVRTLSARFAGALESGRSIGSATIDQSQIGQDCVTVGGASISGTTVNFQVTANFCGRAYLPVVVTLDNGEVIVQPFLVWVQ